jgi:hypothetical protein
MNHPEPQNISPKSRPRMAIITCAVLEIEIGHFAKEHDHVLRIEVLEQGLHNTPDKLRSEAQRLIDQIEGETDAEAIILGYGLCSRGTEGLTTRRCKLVIARAHDCITHLLGSKERYAEYVKERPGTYWYSPGWNQHCSMPSKERYETTYKSYVEKFGEDNAEYLMEMEQGWFKKYSHATFVELGVQVTEKDKDYTRECADWLGWSFDHQRGDPSLIKAMVAGDWDDDRFVVLDPGQTIRITADERVIEAAEEP